MGQPDGIAWARQVFGEPGPRLRELVPQLVAEAHTAMAVAQRASGLDTRHVYGLMWRRTLQEFARRITESVIGARPLKVPRAGYTVVAVNDVAVYPWRYADNSGADPWAARLGDPPSSSRKAVLRGVRASGQLELDLDLSATDADTTRSAHPPGGPEPDDEASEEIDSPAVLIALAELTRTVVVVRYASAFDGLFRVLWGDGRLQDDGTVRGDFHEELAVPPAVRRRAG